MPDFMATYGLSDAEVRAGLRGLEQAASQHTRRMESLTSKTSTSLATVASQKMSKGLFGVGNVATLATASMVAAIAGVKKATSEYSEINDEAAESARRLGYQAEAAWQDLGRRLNGVSSIFDTLIVKARNSRFLTEVANEIQAWLSGVSEQQIERDQENAKAKELETLINRAAAYRNELEAQRLGADPGRAQRLAAAELRAELYEKKALLETEKLRFQLEERGRKDEADRIKRSIAIAKEEIVIAERRKQLAEDVEGRNRTRQELEALGEKYATARESTADTIEANAARIFGLEASERQLKIAEVQLAYDKQLRDLAKDKALLEEDRVRAAGLLNEQRDAELSILMAQRGERRTGRSIALGSSADPRQAFAPIVNEERNDRKKAQEKFDRMVAELRKIRDNTATRQVATYQ